MTCFLVLTRQRKRCRNPERRVVALRNRVIICNHFFIHIYDIRGRVMVGRKDAGERKLNKLLESSG